MRNMIEINELITEGQLIEFEQHIGARLPAEYRMFLLECNGGYPDRSLFMIPNAEVRIVMNHFYGIGDWGCDLKWIYNNYEDMIPRGFISIGDSPNGDEYLLGLCGTKYEGQVFYWQHDVESKEEMDTSYFLANSFDEFMNGLFADTE